MDYVVGSVAALVTGNVTPNRPKFLKRALTPTKHQPSPNVTPKSELVEDRSIFLSPTLQKKKAVVKKSPKRIFENPDLDVTNDEEASSKSKSPKAEKVKKHLKGDLEADDVISPKSLKKKSPSIKDSQPQSETDANTDASGSPQVQNESTPKKKKKKQSHSSVQINSNVNTSIDNIVENNENKSSNLSPKKNKKVKNKNVMKINALDKENDLSYSNEIEDNETESADIAEVNPKSDNKESNDDKNQLKNPLKSKKKNKKQKKKSNNVTKSNTEIKTNQENYLQTETNKGISKKKKCARIVNPNAITNEDTDSEHESDDEIESENEENNKEVLDTGPAEESSDEEEKVPEKKETVQKNKEVVVKTDEEVKKTLFVGNVPFNPKCKKEIKKIFSKYGQIETVRIRTVPVKDARDTPKLAVIKNELHPDRSTVNVYVKFRDASSVNEALAENGTVLNNNHLRVTRSDCTGSEHDPKCSVFIGNLPFALEDEALQQKFEQCGEIESVRIIRDKKTSAGKGFGYVNFKTKDAVELALALSDEDLTIKNRILRVKRCTQTMNKQKSEQENRRGNFQEYHGRGNARGGFGRGNTRGIFGRDDSRGGFGRGAIQGSFGRGNTRGGFGRGDSRGGFGRGDSRGGFGRGNTRGGFGRGGTRGGFGRGHVNRSQFGNREDNGQVGRPAYNDSKADGAMRRLMNKRTNQDGGDGPPNKTQRTINQPGKKQRKEFVGMTAEKKKKNKVDKGQKKKKALSEILTK